MKKTAWNIQFLDKCDSTNSYIKEMKVNGSITDRTAIMAAFQEKGRGQGKNNWHSSAGKNLLVSFYKELEISVANNFMLTVLSSLSVLDVLESYALSCKIKWPNDIYFQDRKLAGILIENALMRDKLTSTIIGLGLNANELSFPDWVPNPCSLFQELNKEIDTRKLCEQIADSLDQHLSEYFKVGSANLLIAYHEKLYRINQWHFFKLNEETISAKIHGVKEDGRLILEAKSGEFHYLQHGEVEHLFS